MTDIVERLRDYDPTRANSREAADEIERLRAARLPQWREWARRDDWHTLFVGSDIREMLSEIERLRALVKFHQKASVEECSEIERLRAALTDIATETCSASGAAGIAKDALAGKTREQWL